MRDYILTSPSLEGILSHYSPGYEGIRRPVEVLRALDGPARRGSGQIHSTRETHILEEYFHDLNGVFMKRFSAVMLQTDITPEDSVKLQAMLQELLNVKKRIATGQSRP